MSSSSSSGKGFQCFCRKASHSTPAKQPRVESLHLGLLSMQPLVFAQTCQFNVDPGSSPGGGKYSVCIQLSNAADGAPFKAVFDMVFLAGFLTILTLPKKKAQPLRMKEEVCGVPVPFHSGFTSVYHSGVCSFALLAVIFLTQTPAHLPSFRKCDWGRSVLGSGIPRQPILLVALC